MTGERNKLIWGEIVARAWRDDAFKQQLLADPKAVLTEAGMSLVDGVELQVVQDTPTLRHLVLPVAPDSGQSLSEAELDLVAGGDSVSTTTNVAQTVEVGTTEVEATETTTTTAAEVEVVVAGVIVLI